MSTAGAVIENQSAVRHVFANSDDLKFWLTGHLDAPALLLADQHVLRLEVAVHQPHRVGRRQPLPRAEKRSDDLRGAPRFFPEPDAQVAVIQQPRDAVVPATAFLAPHCYAVRDPLDLAVVAAAVLGACFGFLWWNAPPARIFMGDTGSLALGGVLAGLAVCTKTQLLLAILGGLFVVIALSVIIQVGSFKMTGRRVFRMAPLQHHFELLGWAETTIVIRFWLICGLFVALGLGIFYVEWMPK